MAELQESDMDDFGCDWDDDPCSWCAGDGTCEDGADPLGHCPDEAHRCHACGGSGRARDQTIW